MSHFDLRCGHVLSLLQQMPDESVNCVVTSPPYWGLRDYGTDPQIWGGANDCEHEWQDASWRPARWGSKDDDNPGEKQRTNSGSLGHRGHVRMQNICGLCGAWRGTLGAEPTPELFVEHLVQVFREIRRVLKNDGTVWLNLGDSYAGSWGNQGRKEDRGTQRPVNGPMVQSFDGYGDLDKRSNTGSWVKSHPTLKSKDLIGIPWRVAFALQADGWYLRAEIIWAKKNCMPESVSDRVTRAHEQIFHLAKSERYYYDADAIREPFATDPKENYPARAKVTGRGDQGFAEARGNDRGKSGGFPPKAAFISDDRKDLHGPTYSRHRMGIDGGQALGMPEGGRNKRSVWSVTTCPTPEAHFATYPIDLIEPCILAGCPEGGAVLDPFNGAATTGLAALKNGRRYIGLELNPEYVVISRQRAQKYYPLLVGSEGDAA